MFEQCIVLFGACHNKQAKAAKTGCFTSQEQKIFLCKVSTGYNPINNPSVLEGVIKLLHFKIKDKTSNT